MKKTKKRRERNNKYLTAIIIVAIIAYVMILTPVWRKNPWFYADYYIYSGKYYIICYEVHPFQLSHRWWEGERPDIQVPNYHNTPLVYQWIQRGRWPQVITEYLVLLIPFLAPAIIMKMAPWFKLNQRRMSTSIVLVFSLITLVYGLISLLSGNAIWREVTYFTSKTFSLLMPSYLYSIGGLLAMITGAIGIWLTEKSWRKVRREHRIPKTVILSLISTILLFLTMTIPIPWIKLRGGYYQHPLMNLGELSSYKPVLIFSWTEKGLWPQVIATLSIGLEPLISMITIGIASLVTKFERKNLSPIAFLTPLLSCVMGLLSLVVFAEAVSSVLTSVLPLYPDPWRPISYYPRHLIEWIIISPIIISSLLGPSIIFITSGVCSIIFGVMALKDLRKSKNT